MNVDGIHGGLRSLINIASSDLADLNHSTDSYRISPTKQLSCGISGLCVIEMWTDCWGTSESLVLHHQPNLTCPHGLMPVSILIFLNPLLALGCLLISNLEGQKYLRLLLPDP